MNSEIAYSKDFLRDLKHLRKKHRSIESDVVSLIADLRENPLQGTDIGLNMRKIRLPISSKGRGKSGGARVITHVTVVVEIDSAKVNLLKIYDKSERESITDAELRALLKKNGLL